MPKKEKKKKNWRERQRERQIKQQRGQVAYQTQRELEAERKPRHYPKGKILLAVCLIAVIFVSYVVWQESIRVSELPPTIGSATPVAPPATNLAPSFSLRDVNGTLFSLDLHSGKVVALHFMAVGCHGQINPINDYQLQQLGTVCSSFCGSKSVTAVTVAVATCENSDLAQLRANYGVTWCLGNDYDDGKMDIVDAYVKYSIQDGTIILVDKELRVAQVYTDAITVDLLSSRINQLLMA